MKSGNLNFLEPSGPPQACTGIALTNKTVSALCHFQRVKRQLSRYIGIFSLLFFSLSLHLLLVAQATRLVILIIV
jgi:hypothetical protein